MILFWDRHRHRDSVTKCEYWKLLCDAISGDYLSLLCMTSFSNNPQ